MENPLEKLPEPVKKYAPFAVAGLVAVVFLASRAKASESQGSSNGVMLPSGGGGVPSQTQTSTPTVGTAAVSDPVAIAKQTAAVQLATEAARFSYLYDPYTPEGSSNPNPNGSTRYDVMTTEQQKSQLGAIAVQTASAQAQSNVQLQNAKAQAEIKQTAEDKKNNIFRDPSSFVKGIGGLAGSLGKSLGIHF